MSCEVMFICVFGLNLGRIVNILRYVLIIKFVWYFCLYIGKFFLLVIVFFLLCF